MDKYLKLKFIKSAVFPQDYPVHSKPEVIVTGRSNAGKSSFLNCLGNERVAKVSQMPGKTTLLNFFEAGQHYVLVDSPGYGYSKRGGDEQASWQRLVEDYFSVRGQLAGILLLMDIRRDWEEEEEMLMRFAQKLKIPLAVIMTKSDRLKPHEVQKAIREMQDGGGIDHIFPISSEKKIGVDVVENFVFNSWIKNWRKD